MFEQTHNYIILLRLEIQKWQSKENDELFDVLSI